MEGLFDFDELLNAGVIENGVMNDMLKASADVAVKAQKSTAETMLVGKYHTGELAKSITKSKIFNTKDGKYIRVYYKGNRRRKKTITSNGSIAYMNEYGKRGQDPRPFIRTANEKCEEEALNAACEIYDKFLDSLGF